VLPERVAGQVRRALEEHGLGRRIERLIAVGGGCISHGARVVTETGASLFLKWNDAAPAGLFDAEADGLLALAQPGAVRVPAPVAWSDDRADGEWSALEGAAARQDSAARWLLMEHVDPGRATRDVDERLGEGLARIHDTGRGASVGGFGWRRDNWIGSLPQENAPCESWGAFWRDRRLAPQLERARVRGHLPDATLDRVLELTHPALADVTEPELVHGDLWGGNWFASTDGAPVLIDPAAYLGHGEVDVAMSELFGGFGPGFYDAYRAANGLSDAYDAYRRDLYQLYYLLVHVNLFGASYEAASLRAARRVVAALSG
jgi:protein-ribulosamine 3-kinase